MWIKGPFNLNKDAVKYIQKAPMTHHWVSTHTEAYLWFRQGLLDSVEGLAVVSVPAQPHPHHSWFQGVYNDLGVSMHDFLLREGTQNNTQSQGEEMPWKQNVLHFVHQLEWRDHFNYQYIYWLSVIITCYSFSIVYLVETKVYLKCKRQPTFLLDKLHKYQHILQNRK